MTFESRKLPGERISSLVEIIKQKGHAVGIESNEEISRVAHTPEEITNNFKLTL